MFSVAFESVSELGAGADDEASHAKPSQAPPSYS